MARTVEKCEGWVRCEWDADRIPVDDQLATWKSSKTFSGNRVKAGDTQSHTHTLDQMMEPEKRLFMLDQKHKHKPFRDAAHLLETYDFFVLLFPKFLNKNLFSKNESHNFPHFCETWFVFWRHPRHETKLSEVSGMLDMSEKRGSCVFIRKKNEMQFGKCL